jgi:hypothetical protein
MSKDQFPYIFHFKVIQNIFEIWILKKTYLYRILKKITKTVNYLGLTYGNFHSGILFFFFVLFHRPFKIFLKSEFLKKPPFKNFEKKSPKLFIILASHMESLILGSEWWKFGSPDMEWQPRIENNLIIANTFPHMKQLTYTGAETSKMRNQ